MMPHFNKSLEKVHATVDTTQKKGFFKKLFAFMESTYLVSVGYMDSGNWATAIVYGEDTDDYETSSDKKVLENYAASIQKLGYNVTSNLGYVSPKKAIPILVNDFNSDVLVLGSHGHK